MTLQHGFADRREGLGEASPPLRGGGDSAAQQAESPRGVIGQKKIKKNARGGASAPDRAPLPWYVCKRCSKRVLSYKKCRVQHYKKCPPYNDNDKVADSVISSIFSSGEIQKS